MLCSLISALPLPCSRAKSLTAGRTCPQRYCIGPSLPISLKANVPFSYFILQHKWRHNQSPNHGGQRPQTSPLSSTCTPDVSFNLQICPFTTGPHTTWILVLTISSLQCLNCFIFILWASILSLLNPSIAIQFKILVHFSLFLNLCLYHLQNHSASELDYSSGLISAPLLSKSCIYFLNGLDYLLHILPTFSYLVSGSYLLLIIQFHSFIHLFIH